ncbi:trypco2 family protein [Streptosporangium algeriense]|uniref:Trypco2 family protein n=1 Tax=Streptosporangium algeriense TaxID=1682748 RepID=A0ABW3DSN3_9ACTN
MEIELSKAVEGLRDELLEAAVTGAGSHIAFAVGPIELEFAVELKADAKAKAGFKAWVVSADTEAGVSRARTHTVRVTLTPKHRDGGDLLITDTSGRIAGPGEVGGHLGR